MRVPLLLLLLLARLSIASSTQQEAVSAQELYVAQQLTGELVRLDSETRR